MEIDVLKMHEKHYSAKNCKIFIILNLDSGSQPFKVAALALDQDFPLLSKIIRPLTSSAYYDR